MKRCSLGLGLALGACRPEPTQQPSSALAPPVAPREPTTIELHGQRLEDPYAWLRDREDPRTRGYLAAENEYTERMMQPYAPLRAKVLGELRNRVIEDDDSVPVKDGAWEYFDREVGGQQYGLLMRTRVGASKPEVVLDLEARARGNGFYELGDYDVTPDGTLLAFTEDVRGDERYRVHVFAIADGRELDAPRGEVGPAIEWASDSRTLFFTHLDAAHREYQVWRRALDEKGDGTLVHDEPDQRFAVGISRTTSGAFMVLDVASQITSEARVIDALHPERAPQIVEPRRDGIEYEIDHLGDRFFVLTNDGARDFRLMETPVAKPGRASWKPIYTPPAGESLTSLQVFATFTVLSGRARGLPQIWIRPHDGGAPWAIDWPERAYEAWLGDNRELDATTIRVKYSSPITADTIYDYDIAKRELVQRKRDRVPSFDPNRFEVERIHARADDGAEIPISLVRRRDAPRPGPLVLHGYGAYGSVYDAEFSRQQLPLLDRGVTMAIAHVRGGGELGRAWYEAGKLAAKINTFTDFIRCAEHLVAEGYTTSDRLLVTGGSAGGLLIGAVINMRPELFHAAVAEVPFVDVINTMRDASLPLTAGEWEEWGDPAKPDAFAWMRTWSPYDNVGAHPYPHLLVVAGWNDSRVGYWEPAKWTARLRATKTGDQQLLLFTQMGSGHGGASGRYDALAERAMVIAFMLERLGVER